MYDIRSNPDRELRRAIEKRLGELHVPAFRGLDISVRRGRVTVRGTLSSYHQKQVCLHWCLHHAGVQGITDETVVDSGW